MLLNLNPNNSKYIYKTMYFWDSYLTMQYFVYNTWYMLHNSLWKGDYDERFR